MNTPHDWMIAPYGYDPGDYCRKCGCSSYETGTSTCEEYKKKS